MEETTQRWSAIYFSVTKHIEKDLKKKPGFEQDMTGESMIRW